MFYFVFAWACCRGRFRLGTEISRAETRCAHQRVKFLAGAIPVSFSRNLWENSEGAQGEQGEQGMTQEVEPWIST